MNKYPELRIGEVFSSGQATITILDKDRLCYSVKSVCKGATGIRTISKTLLSEFVDYLNTHPHATPTESRLALVGRSDIDKFEYGYVTTIYALAQRILTTKTINITLPLQQIYFGCPGCGKSHTIKTQVLAGINTDNIFRTIFHPDSDYSSFVGSYKPVMENDVIKYKFIPQAFTNAYIRAWNNPEEAVFLVIEEINRGNCAQIFGDLFQLLDREDGVSEYPIKADTDLCIFLENKLGADNEGIANGNLKLPANLNIIATMNTSDQSLFPMDSAFKRRWDWKYIPIDYNNGESSKFTITIGEKKYKWVDFLRTVNQHIREITSSEDKQMGDFFIKSDIEEEDFVDKVMFYLWSEVCKDEYHARSFFRSGGKEFSFGELAANNRTELLQGFMDDILKDTIKKDSEETDKAE